MTQQLLNTFIAKEVVRRWTDDQLIALPTKLCKQVGLWNDGVKIDPELQIIMAKGDKNPTIADKISALKIAQQAMWKKTAHLNIEDSVIKAGGTLFYTPTTIVHTKLDTTTVTYVNSPIPTPVGTEIVRPHIDSVAAFCGQIIRQSGAEWTPQVQHLSTVFGSDGIDISSSAKVASLLIKIIHDDKTWNTLTSVGKLAVTGIRSLVFIKEVLGRVDDIVYDYINTVIVVDCLRAVIKDGSRWTIRMLGEKNAVSTACYEAKAIKKSYADQFSAYPAVFLYRGGFIPQLTVPAADGTLVSAVAALSKLRIVAGSDNSPVFLLSGMRGMSGFSDDLGKRLQFTLAATLGMWRSGRQVDIRLSSIGDVAVLSSSLTYWWNKVAGDWKLNPDIQWFKFIAPTRAPLNLPEALKTQFISTHREKSVAIWYSDSHLPTSAEKRVAVDYDAASENLVPGDVTGDFIAYSPIYGASPFAMDQSVDSVLQKRTYTVNRRYHAFEFGTSNCFRGVISTFANISLFGFGWDKKGPFYDMSENPKLVLLPLKLFKYQSEWYKNVVQDCTAAYSLIFTAVSRYSPISSLLYMSKKYVQLDLAQPILDGDPYVADIIRVKRSIVGKAFVPPVAVEDDDDQGPAYVIQKRLEKFDSNSSAAPIRDNYFSVPGDEDSDEDDPKQLEKMQRELVEQIDQDKI
jgi:hypothetical protein